MTSPTGRSDSPSGHDGAPDPEAGSQSGIAPDIEPDQKDWTWVLERPCDERGFDAGALSGRQVAAMLRANAVSWAAVLRRADAASRPERQVWSPLEYACHVRDVCRVFESRVNLMRLQVDPLFDNWDQDATAVADAYGAQDPAAVSVELSAAAEAAAAAFDAVTDGDWQRTGRRSNGSTFTIETLGKYLIHDLAHHVHDVRG
ncbi:MAG: DinB family protein [Phycicoccus sp.]|nr:DinB family protein [Phycicoccus sp.]NMM33254.1 DinB family protein [Phycicoccus sp.]